MSTKTVIFLTLLIVLSQCQCLFPLVCNPPPAPGKQKDVPNSQSNKNEKSKKEDKQQQKDAIIEADTTEFRRKMMSVIDQAKDANSPLVNSLMNKLIDELMILFRILDSIHGKSYYSAVHHDKIKAQVTVVVDLVMRIDAELFANKKCIVKGNENVIVGEDVDATGNKNQVLGSGINVIGSDNQVAGVAQTVCGNGNYADGCEQFCIGNNMKMEGNKNIAFGCDKNVCGDNKLVVDKFVIDLNKLDKGNKDCVDRC